MVGFKGCSARVAVLLLTLAGCDGGGDAPTGSPGGTRALNAKQFEAPPATAPVLSATAPASDTVALSWTATAGATSYYVDRSTTGGTTWSQVASISGTSWTDTSKAAGTAYCYQVRTGAFTSNGACVLTPFTYVATSQTKTVSGGTASSVTDSASSTGKVLSANLTAVGSYIELSLDQSATGTYDVKLHLRKSASAAKFQLLIDGTAMGAEVDGYAAATGYADVDLGLWNASGTGSTRKFRFLVTGKNAASTGYAHSGRSGQGFRSIWAGNRSEATGAFWGRSEATG